VPEPDANPKPVGKLTPRYRAVLVAAAVGILVIGSALRPRERVSETTSPPSQTELSRLRELAERQSLEAMTHHFAGVAASVAPRLVRVGPAWSTGIAWETDLVVAAGQAGPAADSARLVMDGGEQLAATRVAGGPGLPLSAFRAAGRLEPAARRPSGAPELAPGQWLVAVWRGNAGPAFAAGHYVETRPTRCGELSAREVATSQGLGEPMAGAGLFDLDGVLVAVVLPCDGRYAALSLESVTLGLAQGRSPEGRLRAVYGLRVVALDEASRRHLGTDSGVLVSDVWEGFPADLAGVRPGDAIVGVGGHPVTSPEDLQPLLVPVQEPDVELAVWRTRRKLEIRLSARGPEARPSPAAEAGPGLSLAPPVEGFRIGPVAPGSPAAEAGIREGDELLRVDSVVPRTPAEAGRALSRRGRPVFVEVRSGPRRFGALIEPR
jgi:serine protease Do